MSKAMTASIAPRVTKNMVAEMYGAASSSTGGKFTARLSSGIRVGTISTSKTPESLSCYTVNNII